VVVLVGVAIVVGIIGAFGALVGGIFGVMLARLFSFLTKGDEAEFHRHVSRGGMSPAVPLHFCALEGPVLGRGLLPTRLMREGTRCLTGGG
jgi:hypothetical protein